MRIPVRKSIKLVLFLVTGLFIIPPIINQFIKSSPRKFAGVDLADTHFQEIRFRNDDQHLDLSGLLFVPDGEGPFPAAVIIHGSGPSRRDNGWYLTMVQYLQENGILVLLPDKRGSGESEGEWQTASFHDLATDTKSAVSYLSKQQKFPIEYIGIIGMSQGGHIAPIAAQMSPDIQFIINVVGAAVPMADQFLYEENHNLRQMGFLPGFSDLLAHITTFYHRNLGSNKEFWKATGDYDPIPDWKKVDQESMILYGEKDTNVPSEASAASLRTLNKSNINIKIYKGSGHALEDPPGKGNSIFREDALNDVTEFILSW